MLKSEKIYEVVRRFIALATMDFNDPIIVNSSPLDPNVVLLHQSVYKSKFLLFYKILNCCCLVL